MDYTLLAEKLVKDALKKGADAAEAYLEAGRELSVEVRNDEVETVQESASHGAGLRVFVKNRMAFACCNDFSESALRQTVESAVRMAKVTTEDENNVLPGESPFIDVEGLYDPDYDKVSMEKRSPWRGRSNPWP